MLSTTAPSTYGAAGIPIGRVASITPLVQLVFPLQVAGVPQFFPPQWWQAQPLVQNESNIQIVVTMLDNNSNPINIKGASSTNILLIYPNGATKFAPSSFLTSGIDGSLTYTIQPGDLSQFGLYGIRGLASFGSSQLITELGYSYVNPEP